MQRRVNQTNDDRVAVHGFEQPIEILALGRKQFIQSLRALFAGIRKDHALNDRQSLRLEEHMLGAA